jgi:hypothetical protein
MKLFTNSFSVNLDPLRVVDEEDWVRVHVTAKADVFTGDFDAWLQLNDLVCFKTELEHMDANIGKSNSAQLVSHEPGVDITLSMQPLGQIEGSYVFENESTGRGSTKLSGSFELDQSYLPALMSSVESLILELGGASS